MPAHQQLRPASDNGGGDAYTLASSQRHGERVQSGLTQRDMWVMHSQLQGATLGDICVGATHASPLRNDAPLDTRRGTACRAPWRLALVPPPPSGYTLSITILSTSSLTRSLYRIGCNPGHYSRCIAVRWVLRHEREVDGSSSGSRCISLSDRRSPCAPSHRPRPSPDGSDGDGCTRAGSPRHGERLMWVMHSAGGSGE